MTLIPKLQGMLIFSDMPNIRMFKDKFAKNSLKIATILRRLKQAPIKHLYKSLKSHKLVKKQLNNYKELQKTAYVHKDYEQFTLNFNVASKKFQAF